MKRTLIAVILGTLVISSPALAAKKPNAPTPPPAGAYLDAKFWHTFARPGYRIGERLTYKSECHFVNLADGPSTTEVATECMVFQAVDPKVSIVADGGDKEDLANSAALDLMLHRTMLTVTEAPNDLLEYRSMGADDVKAGPKTYRDAAKVTHHDSDGSEVTEWYAAGVGLVKRTISKSYSNGIRTRILELVDFKR